MTWVEEVQVLGGATSLLAGISEHAPRQSEVAAGQTAQQIKLLLPSGEILAPPTRLTVRGEEVRVLGTQAPPRGGLPSIVTCERINPDLPDEVRIIELGEKTLNEETGRLEASETARWSGMAHIVSGVPATVDMAGEIAPLDKVTITLPMAAVAREGLRLRVIASRTPGVMGDDFGISGEVLDSSGSLRRVIGYRLGR